MTNPPLPDILNTVKIGRWEAFGMIEKRGASIDVFKCVFWARTALVTAIIAGIAIIAFL